MSGEVSRPFSWGGGDAQRKGREVAIWPGVWSVWRTVRGLWGEHQPTCFWWVHRHSPGTMAGSREGLSTEIVLWAPGACLLWTVMEKSDGPAVPQWPCQLARL